MEEKQIKLPVQKITIIGDSGVGKSSLLLRYLDHTFQEYVSTIGVDFRIKNHEFDGTEVKIQIWDAAGGRERFSRPSSAYYRGSNGIILAFDLTNEYSFKLLDKWLVEVEKFAPEGAPVILVGTKCDLVETRCIEEDVARLFAVENKLQYFETSSKTGENIDGTLNGFINELIEKNRHSFVYDGKAATIAPIMKEESNYCLIL